MQKRPFKRKTITRRTFLKGVGYAPMLFLPAPLQDLSGLIPRAFNADLLPTDVRVKPHYPSSSPLDDVLRQVMAGSDDYPTEKYAFEIEALLNDWGQALRRSSPALEALARIIGDAIQSGSLTALEEKRVHSDSGFLVLRRNFGTNLSAGAPQFLSRMRESLAQFTKIETAEFEITSLAEIAASPLRVSAEIRYTLIGISVHAAREQRIGYWKTSWVRDPRGSWLADTWYATNETMVRAGEPAFTDISTQALGMTDSYNKQLLRSVDDWRTLLDGAVGVDVYGNSGVAVGDFDNDGFDDIYVCQPAGLPNRLYRNRGDGTFEDVSRSAGVDVLDSTSCALFVDFENKGVQDLLVVTGGGPLLFANQGHGQFTAKRDAFRFVSPPQGTFTHAAAADYDRDGFLDVYFCLYNYYAGLDQYRYPSPYFDARNGPPNFLFHNRGNGTFEDRTQAAGLNAENDRFSFACAWGDLDSDGWPDLYVANDFGRSNLYRNNRDGTFKAISAESAVDDAGAGMSACWLDFDGDGMQDIYVGNMWSSAGMRVSDQETFHQQDPAEIRNMYRRHARGNSLYKNGGAGKFGNVGEQTGVNMGRWAWSCDSWDFDHDGRADLYIANGYISGSQSPDLASFFWRQVVAKSPRTLAPSPEYEHGWNAINELIRSDATWNGYERNTLYLNNGDGTFSDVSGVSGLDFPDDSRSFAIADLDHDGRLEIILKNRTAPQVRILRNAMRQIGNSITFRLHGTKSHRDAIGTAVTVEAAGLRQTKYLQAGSGFLSQHTKELHFGLEKTTGTVQATVKWPSGTTQVFSELPLNARIEITEGSEHFASTPFKTPPPAYLQGATLAKIQPLPSPLETWLVEPLPAPDFSLPDLTGKQWSLSSLRGRRVLLIFWATASRASIEQLQLLRRPELANTQVLAINVDDPADVQALRAAFASRLVTFPLLRSTTDVTGTYNLVFRYLFDRRRDLALPTSFLIDETGMIVKVYQGVTSHEHISEDLKSIPKDAGERLQRALPFDGTLHLEQFRRNDFTYGVAFFQHGYFDQAAESFRQVISKKPDDPEAYYNLGTLNLRRNNFQEARQNLEKSVQLRPTYAEAWNNLGMLAAEEGDSGAAVRNFKQSLSLRPDYTVALVNLGNVYRREKLFSESEQALRRALQLEPNNPEINYSMGMLYGQQNQVTPAKQYLSQALSLRPNYPEALNNLGVLLVREQNYPGAEAKFEACIQSNPNFDQAYMNLARLYVILNEKEKARATLEALLQHQPQHKLAQQALEMLK